MSRIFLDTLQIAWLSVRRVDHVTSIRCVGNRRAGLHVSQLLYRSARVVALQELSRQQAGARVQRRGLHDIRQLVLQRHHRRYAADLVVVLERHALQRRMMIS